MYRVQNTSNTITWTFNQGDPNPIDILVVNADNKTLNGQFAIVSSANVSAEVYFVCLYVYRVLLTSSVDLHHVSMLHPSPSEVPS